MATLAARNLESSRCLGQSVLKNGFQTRQFGAGVAAHIRNCAIVAHVDHGKTTMVDALLKSAGYGNLNDRAMDSNALEKERGITILSKTTSVKYKDTLVNLVDTPGHSDFAGEVERVLSMVDGICLVVDATDGPMTQTKYVLKKALAQKLTPIVVINKVDRPTARVDEVELEVMELFDELSPEHEIEYETIYACGKAGWAAAELPDDDVIAKMEPDMSPLLDCIVKTIPAPQTGPHDAFRMLVTIMESDPSVHLGKLLLTGRIESGSCKPGDKIVVLNPDGTEVEEDSSVVRLYKREGTVRKEVSNAKAGDIVTIAGVNGGRVADTLIAPEIKEAGPIAGPVLDPPTISMFFAVNDSPFAGNKELSGGTKLTSQAIKERLLKEMESNIAIKIGSESVVLDGRDSIEVYGRGEMQLGILLENMRREGFELSVSPPRALMKEVDGKLLEPVEEVILEFDESFSGSIIEALHPRKAELIESTSIPNTTRQKIRFYIPSRGLVGFRSFLIKLCRGDIIIQTLFHDYLPYMGQVSNARKGALVSMDSGVAPSYGLVALEPRGELFITPGQQVYSGMIIGEHSRGEDLDVNPTKTKKLTNIRAAGKDEFVRLTPVKPMMLEDMISYIQEDEIVEITPKQLRLRKSILDPSIRKSQARRTKKNTI